MRFSLVFFVAACIATVGCQESDSTSPSNTGQGGSLARFAFHHAYLYVVTDNSLKVFIANGGEFNSKNSIDIGPGIETIFAQGDFLYLGAQDAMYIYSVTEPESPSFVFRYPHIASCDPVVVQGNLAYVTLSSGNRCNRGVNALEIIDITDRYNPVLLSNYPMVSPGGLGISGNCLFVCEGADGLKMLDVTNPLDVKLIKQITNEFAYDVIVSGGVLKLTGKDGIFQYQYNCVSKEVTLLSKIPVQREII